MKTVGEILKTKRSEKQLSLEAVEEEIRIRKKFLEALENDDWQQLPSLTYARGFIKNYAEWLDLDTVYVLSVFRRQMAISEKQKVVPAGLVNPLNEPFLRITPTKILAFFTSVLLLVFFFWLFGQYRGIIFAPKINLEKPTENEIIRFDKVTLVGQTDNNATLTLNGQPLDLTNGKFTKEISVSSGTVILTLEATNKFGKKGELKRTIRAENP